ncbi:glycosyltransferase [Burkholderia sp. Ax-1719]|uniref:glycosyltransferase n=1 Tax=Burkholderia sp. Ax-1719 TaxID=2608334 RepID=UPI00141F4581|nr:glycosyltransferase [Burkholderia sp. Ax-1719]NIE63346.1 glycosyltransferase [Burkholderia sp. Ax-1719]
MIGVIIPAHNEADLLASCLAAACATRDAVGLRGEPVNIVVVLDGCTDESEAIVSGFEVTSLHVDVRNVGVARRAGAERLIAQGARWLAFTDADSRVENDWLVAQLALGVDAVCGSVQVDDWEGAPGQLRERWRARYRDADGHRHVHGANLGVSTHAYLRAGGFPPLACGEDVALVDLLRVVGATIAWSAAPRVRTSARMQARVRGGFADTLARWAQEE